MKKILAIALVAFIAVFSVFAGGASEEAPSTLKIGFIGPLTGDNANYGIRCANAARLAIN